MPRALIIGAGPAGSMAAIGLRKLDWHVTLIEQHRFPRDKVCGECLSPLGFDVLSRSGFESTFRSLRPVEMTQTIFHARDGHTCQMALPRSMSGISRRVFDEFLLNQARRSGASILQPARCESIQPGGARVHDLMTNQIKELAADCILLADGKCALNNHRPSATSEMGIKTHWMNVEGPRNAVELFALDAMYGGLAPIEDGLWNTAFSVPAEVVRTYAGDLEAMLNHLISQNTGLTIRLRKAKRLGPILASPLPRFGCRRQFPSGIIPIGNAAAAIEPIGGEGMGLALASAELAAEWIDARYKERLPFDYADLAPAFSRLWRVKGAAYRSAGLFISNNSLASAGLDFLSSGFGQQTFSRILEFLVCQNPRPAQA